MPRFGTLAEHARSHRTQATAGLGLCLLAALPGGVWAGELQNDSWLDCRAIEDQANRLACYDAAAQAATETASTNENTAASQSADSTDTAASNAEATKPVPALSERLANEQASEANPFAIRAYKPNYILVASYTPTNLSNPVYDFKPQHVEAKFQLSFQFNLWNQPFGPNTAIYAAYSQTSFWQSYNSSVFGSDASAPFRETDYEPEIGLDWTTDYHLAGLTFKKVRFSVIHQSNGQGGARSRSWNRLVLGTAFERGRFAAGLKAWYRIPESAASDDNPDITNYLGHGELLMAYKWDKQTLSATLRNNLRHKNKGSIQLDYSFPLTRRIKGYVQYFNGYGESLIDYNRSISRIGIGIALSDWL